VITSLELKQHQFYEILELMEDKAKGNGRLELSEEQTRQFLAWLRRLVTVSVKSEILLKELNERLTK
jgi:hypothetical protein